MPEALRQTLALARLLGRHWSRSSMVAGKAPTRGGGRAGAGLLLRALFAAMMAQAFYGAGARAAALRDTAQATSAVRWLLVGVFLYVAAVALTIDAPELPGAKQPLRRPLLAQLPLRPTARVAFVLLQEWIVLPPAIAGIVGAAHGSPSAVLRSSLGGALLFASAALTGIAATSALRMFLPPHRLSRLAWVALPFLIAGPVLAVSGPILARWSRPLPWDVTLLLARALLRGDRMTVAAALLCVPGLAGAIVFGLAERVGYDRIDAAPPRPPKPSGAPIDLATLDRLLARRELGARAMLIPIVFSLIGSSLLAAAFRKQLVRHPELHGGIAEEAVTLVGFFVAQLAASVALTRAGRGVLRDAQARPLLASLPIAASDTLRGKARALRPHLFPVLALYVPWIVVAPGLLRVELAWRAVASGIALFFFAEAAVSVSFLTNGLGAPGARSAGQPLSLGSLLLALPFFGVCLASSPFAAAVALAALFALSWEARRSAMRCLDVVDDADEALPRETETWRALLVLGGFYAVQSLGARALAAFAPEGAGELVAALSSLAASVALFLLVQTEGVKPSSFRLLPERRSFLALGVVAGAVTGLLGASYARLLAAPGPSAPMNLPATVVAALAAVVAAPLAEGLFFRGWLQRAIGDELPISRRRLAVVIAALACAAAHPPSSVVPVALLALTAGLLVEVSGALAVGVVAHATHAALMLTLVR